MRSAWVLEVTLGALMVAVMIALGWRLAEFLALPFGELRHVKMLARCGRRKTPMPRPARSPDWGSFCTVVGRASVWERSTAGLVCHSLSVETLAPHRHSLRARLRQPQMTSL
jgi:hypothetical protein